MRLLLPILIALSGRVSFSAPAPAASGVVVSPGYFLEAAGTRILTIESQSEGKFSVSIFNLGSGGAYSRTVAIGELEDKGLVFGLRNEEGDAGPKYLATASQTKLTVKIKPGQPGAADGGFSGNYSRMTEEKFSNVMKKDYEFTEKKLETAVRDLAKRLKPDDKPGLAEWKKRWPEIRDRVVSGKVKAAQPATASKPGFSTAVSQQKPASYWMGQAEALNGAINFVMNGVPLGLPPGWEGRYEDGFGGFVDLETRKSGDLVIELNSQRGDSMNGKYDGRVPAKGIKPGRDGKEDTADFLDTNPDATKDGAPAMHVKLHRIGNFLVVETTEAQRYAGKGWFDGVYIKRSRPEE